MKHTLTLIIFSLHSSAAFASDMGNGPAALVVWILGLLLSIVISIFISIERNEVGEFTNFRKGKFTVCVILCIPIVFVAGVIAIFT